MKTRRRIHHGMAKTLNFQVDSMLELLEPALFALIFAAFVAGTVDALVGGGGCLATEKRYTPDDSGPAHTGCGLHVKTQ
jgi:hypothetical protein